MAEIVEINRQREEQPESEKPGIQSVEIAAHILSVMAQIGTSAKLRDLANACDMPSGKVHRYLVSMVRSGLAEQIPETGLYRIGSLSISAGLAGLAQTDAVKLAGEALSGLRDATGETAVLAVWSERGPTVVRLEESARPVTMNIRVGSALPLTKSALGLVFLAFLSTENTAPLLKAETVHAGQGADDEDLHTVERVKNTWEHGLSRI
jgi:DNA-binding IclR family transcriptional regulator